MRLRCYGSTQGREGCMVFFRPSLPDGVACEYDLTVRSQGGLLINYVAMRGQGREDAIEDRDKLEARTGIMANYYAAKWGLQSYHVSFSRFNDSGAHTGTSNWRRNPGSMLMSHGTDPVREIGRRYCVRIVKSGGHCQLAVDGQCAHGFADRDSAHGPIPDTGQFVFRLIGADVTVDIANFVVHRVEHNRRVWGDRTDYTG